MKLVFILLAMWSFHLFANPSKSNEELLKEAKVHLSNLEQKFKELDIEKTLNKASVSELDSIKNDFYDYKELLDALSMLGSDDKEKYLNIKDSKETFKGIGLPMATESFSSEEVRQRLRMAKSFASDHAPENIVYAKFKMLVLNLDSALTRKESESRAERKKTEEAKREIDRKKKVARLEEHNRVQASPGCKKANAFKEYCNSKLNVEIFSSGIAYEKMISKRSGTESSKVRGFTKMLVFNEDKLSEHQKEYLSIPSPGPNLNECSIVTPKDYSQPYISNESKSIIDKTILKNCGQEM